MIIRQTRDTLSPIYFDALTIRKEVFVDEQKVPVSLEIDQEEANAIHFVLYQEDDPIATARILSKTPKLAKLQRMAVRKTARGAGNGAFLIRAVEKVCQEMSFETIQLGAQLSAEGFYQTLGYTSYGEQFLDAGIQHISMQKHIAPLERKKD
jgi:predicted GNAT family N-acyltransferase